MANPDRAFAATVDQKHDSFTSVVLRYRGAVRLGESDESDHVVKEALSRTSIREGLRIVPLLEYRNVHVDVLDETSRMHTHTLKSIDGAVSAARCQVEGLQQIVVESGGNTATAIAAYAPRAGIDVTCFVPEENLGLLDGEFFRHERVRLVSVADPALVKPAAERYAHRIGARRVPEVGWRLQASRFVGCFLRESFLGGTRYDWLAQTISAAFGPIGIYAALEDAAAGARVPRFLGIQQAANCPMYRAWKEGRADAEGTALHSTRNLLTPVMYDGAPGEYGTFLRLKELLQRSRGDLITIDAGEFRQALIADGGRNVLAALGEQGIDIATVDGEVIEKTGMLTLAGVFKAIREGQIAGGSRVLACLTSGVRRSASAAVPFRRLEDLDSLEVGDR